MSTKSIFYAAVGAGDLVVEKARKAQSAFDFDIRSVRKEFPKALQELGGRYELLVQRGRKTVKTIRSSTPTRKAMEQAKTARSQTKAAVTSARKAAEATVEATKGAATKVG